MIVERKEDGTANAYCFRCGGSGYHSYTRHFKSAGTLAKSYGSGSELARTKSPGISPPDDADGQWGGFPREVKEWLLKGGVNDLVASKYGFSWSDSQERLWIEARQYSKVTTGYKVAGHVVRGFNPKSYLTRTHDKDNFFGYYVTDNPHTEGKIMIVEDVVSAIKCAQVIDSVAIFGVHPKPSIIQHILSGGYRQAYVFLDADNPTVRMKAREIPKRLPFIKSEVIELGYDPKYCSIEQLKELTK